jgi:hypothetical protein
MITNQTLIDFRTALNSAIKEVAPLCNYLDYSCTSLSIGERIETVLEARYSLKNYLFVSLVKGTESELLAQFIKIDDNMPNFGTAHAVTGQGSKRFQEGAQLASTDFNKLIPFIQKNFMEMYTPKKGKIRSYKAKMEELKSN